MNPITMKLVVDDLILQALREDITFEDASTASVCPRRAPLPLSSSPRPTALSPAWTYSPAPLSCWIRRAPCCSMSRMATRCTPAITWARCAATRACCFPGERVALNYLQRMSGIATYTHWMAAAPWAPKPRSSTRARPRRQCVFEKAAVEIGGGSNHRDNLSTAVMLQGQPHRRRRRRGTRD